VIDNPKMNKSELAACLIEARVKAGQATREAAIKRLAKQGKIESREKKPGSPNAGYLLIPLVFKVVEPVEPKTAAAVNGAATTHAAAQGVLVDMMDGPS
jgi:hypothetical protein